MIDLAEIQADTRARRIADAVAEKYRKIATAAMCCRKIEFNDGGAVYDAAGGVMDSFDPEATVISGSGQRFTGDCIASALLEMYAAEFEPENDHG